MAEAGPSKDETICGTKRDISNVEDTNDCTSDQTSLPNEQDLLLKNLKHKVTLFIAYAHSAIHAAIMGNEDNKMMNINVGMQIHKILVTAYKTLVKRVNSITSRSSDTSKKSICHTVNYLGKIYKKDRQYVENIVLNLANEYGLEFKKFKKANHDSIIWYGMANTIMDFLSGFELRIREIQINNFDEVQVLTSKGEKILIPITQYRLKPYHHRLLEGITFSPGKRRRMVKTLGPMTALIGLIEEKEYGFVKKWLNEVEMACGMIPGVDGILESLRHGKSSAIQNIVRYLADICMLTLPRRDNTIFPPPNVFSRIFEKSDHTIDNEKFTRQEILDCFDFTKNGAQVFYKIMSEMRWKICGNYNESQARQIVYHATFGTYTEDLSILGKITDETNWHVRDHFNNCFLSRQTNETREIDFIPVKQNFWSITEAKIEFRLNTQLCCAPVFSGYQIQCLDLLMRARSLPSCGDITGFTAHFKNYYDELEKKYAKEGKRQDTGRTKWYRTDVTPSHMGTCENINFDARSKFFLPQES